MVLAGLIAPTAHAATDAPEITPVIQDVLSPPRWYEGDDGRVHLSYELLLTNAAPVATTVQALEVLDQRGRRLARLTGARLRAAMGWPTAPRATRRLAPFAVGIAFPDLTFRDAGSLPRRIRHRLTVRLAPGLPVPSVVRNVAGEAAVTRRKPVAIAPPLAGSGWIAIVGAHRRAVQPVDGALDNGQRFAVDFAARLDASGRALVGDPALNPSWVNFGAPVLAVGDATVVTAVDRFPDQPPDKPAQTGVEEADGNHVILRLADGTYAGYAHLVSGSVRVRAGQRVRAGEVLGLLGNSGNTTGPHLHFQLMTRPSLLVADGLPFELSQFRIDGHVPSLDAMTRATEAGTPIPVDRSGAGDHRDQGLLGLEVLTFPG